MRKNQAVGCWVIDFTLMKHQSDIRASGMCEPDLFLAWEMGVGKSCATIQLIRDRIADASRLKRTLILAPLIVLQNWKKEFAMFSNIDKESIIILDGPIKKRIERVKSMQKYNCIFLCNYDVIQDLHLATALEAWNPEILVCDEAHNLKNYKSKRAKAVAKISDLGSVKNRYLLTGTPILNNAMDIFMQYRILDGYLGKGATFGANFFAFRAMFFKDSNANWSGKTGYYPSWVPREGAYTQLMQLISQKTTRILKKDCLDLPDLIVQEIEVQVGAEQKRAYEEMRKDLITFISVDSGQPRVVVARMALTKALRLQQIISGFYKTETGEPIRIRDNPRMAALKELLEIITLDNKVIVWCCFKENYKMIGELCEELKIKAVFITGDETAKDKNESIRLFDEDSSVRVCIANQSAGGVGINLIRASYSIYYSRGFKLGDDSQSESRNHRRGSEIHQKITRINLVAKNSIDGIISDALARKIDISDQILDLTDKL